MFASYKYCNFDFAYIRSVSNSKRTSVLLLNFLTFQSPAKGIKSLIKLNCE